MEDLYRILGINQRASADEIRERYRFLAQAFHPDKFSSLKQKQQAEEEFKMINNAYQILSVPLKRNKYDREKNLRPNHPQNTTVDKKKQEEQAARRKQDEAARQRAREEIARQEAQKRRSKRWIEENQTIQKGAKLRGVDLRNGNLPNANFEDADLRDANLNGAYLAYAKLVRADLTNSKLIYVWLTSLTYGETRGADLTKAVLKGADLRYARLGYVNFSAAVLENAELTGGLMHDVNLTGANLKGANLTKADLTRANLTNAILAGANLNNTDLGDANLTNVKLVKTNFKGALYSEKTIWPKNFDFKGAGAILNDIYYKVEQNKIEQEERTRQEEQEKEMRKEGQIPRSSHFPANCVRLLNSWPEFACTTIGNRTTWVFATGCSTIELIGSENRFVELVVRIDYVNENWLNYWWFLPRIKESMFGEQDYKTADDWLDSQLALANSSPSDIQAERIFGDYLLAFRSKYHEGIHEYSFTPARKERA